MSHTCPYCGGAGTDPDALDTECPICFGHAYVLALAGTKCPDCGGLKREEVCPTCKGDGRVPDNVPFTLPIREVDGSVLSRAFTQLRVGGHQLDEGAEVDPFTLGVATGLLTISRERSESFGWEPGEMLESLTEGVLRLSPSGIWHFPDPSQTVAVQVVRFAAKD